MQIKILLVLLIFSFGCQTGKVNEARKDHFTIAFYNVENLFDTADDPLTADEDFTPEGAKQWTQERYVLKLQNLAKVVDALHADILGVAEVENRKVLEDLAAEPLLSEEDFGVIHKESPDHRGIDVALLYQKSKFAPLSRQTYSVTFPSEPDYTTREILYVTGLAKKDTLHVFVNHWPSRRGGQEASEPKRVLVAQKVEYLADSIKRNNPSAHIIIMGDLNDEPHNKSVFEVLNAKGGIAEADEFYNPMYRLKFTDSLGTYKYKANWNMLDHIILSRSLVEAKMFTPENANIFRPEWLLQEDKYNGGIEPNRSYFGRSYRGGYSDHLPVYVRLKVK